MNYTIWIAYAVCVSDLYHMPSGSHDETNFIGDDNYFIYGSTQERLIFFVL